MSLDRPQTGSVRLTVLQGQFKVSAGPRVELSTVLGSCVATCLFDPVVELGGMNHFLLAEPPASHNRGEVDVHYGVYLMEMLINEMLAYGAAKIAAARASLRRRQSSAAGCRQSALQCRICARFSGARAHRTGSRGPGRHRMRAASIFARHPAWFGAELSLPRMRPRLKPQPVMRPGSTRRSRTVLTGNEARRCRKPLAFLLSMTAPRCARC